MNMTFHTSLIVSGKLVWSVLLRNFPVNPKIFEDFSSSRNLSISCLYFFKSRFNWLVISISIYKEST